VATLKKYDIKGKEVGTAEVDDALVKVKCHPQSVKDYLVAIRKNARQWSANTKTRAQVQRTGRKPHPQKGQGRSRQGDLAAPQYKGGGIVFGPKPKFDMHVRINKKERRAAIRALIAEKIKENRVHVLTKADLKTPSTKTFASFFDKLKLKDRRALLLVESEEKKEGTKANLVKSIRNLPKKSSSQVPQLNGQSVILAQDLVILESALDEFLAMLG
jgi:large subunit ribosomal protein L4